MKPDWKAAPDWAQYLAQDANGEWFWYAQEPILLEHQAQWANREDSRFCPALAAWKETLEKRPTHET